MSGHEHPACACVAAAQPSGTWGEAQSSHRNDCCGGVATDRGERCSFGTKAGVPESQVSHRPAPGFVAAPVLLGLASVAAGFLGGPLTAALTPWRA